MKAIEIVELKLAAATAELAELKSRLRHDYVERAEYNRVQAGWKREQAFRAKYHAKLVELGVYQDYSATPRGDAGTGTFAERMARQDAIARARA